MIISVQSHVIKVSLALEFKVCLLAVKVLVTL